MSVFGGSFYSTRAMFMAFLFIVFFFVFETPTMASEFSGGDDEFMINLAGYGETKLSTVLVGGTLICEACSNDETQLHRHAVSGASVVVSCHRPGQKTKKTDWVRGTTDDDGDFLIDLPSHLHGIPNLDKICHVQILQLPKTSHCRHAFTGKHKGMTLSSFGDGVRTYTTDVIRMRPKARRGCMHTHKRKEERESKGLLNKN